MNLQEPSAAVAFGLGLWAAVQPCPMTANVAAVAWLARRAEPVRAHASRRLFAAVLFILGQTVTYVALAWLALAGIASSSRISLFLQGHVNEVLGPVWIVAGMVLLGLIEFRMPRVGRAFSPRPPGEGQGVRAERIWMAFPLGILLALAFCPVTAVLFFVNLLTIAAAGGSRVVYPLLYALGAALPVAVLALLLAAGSQWLGTALNRTQQVQRWLNRLAGGVMLAVGVYSCLRFNFEFWPF